MGSFLRPTGDALTAEDRIVSAGIWIALVAVFLQTTIHLANALFFGAVSSLDVNREHNPFAWAATVAIFAVAFAASVRAITVTDRRRRFLLLAAVAAFFSLDEMVIIHERLGRGTADLLGLSEAYARVIWPILYAPMLAVAAVLLLTLPRGAPRRVRRLAAAGVGLLVLAVVAEVASLPVPAETAPGENWAHTLEGAFEEGAELGAWILLAAAFAAIAWDRPPSSPGEHSRGSVGHRTRERALR